MNENKQGFAEVKSRLDDIVEEVSDESISLDDALGLYEEAIKLGMQVSSLLEEDIAADQISAAVEALDPAEEKPATPDSIQAEVANTAPASEEVPAGDDGHE